MADLLIITQRGYGKRVRPRALAFQDLGSEGECAIKLDENDAVAAAVLAEPNDDVIIVTAAGQALRMRAGQVRELSPDAPAERLMTVHYPDHGQVDRVTGAVVVPGA